MSSPAVILAAIAQATEKIRLTSAVSVLSVLDPVRLYQDFASLDLASGGRAEIAVGRSAFVEPFALFGSTRVTKTRSSPNDASGGQHRADHAGLRAW